MANNFNKFSQIADALNPFLHGCVTNTAKEIVSDFSANCAYDTGFMSESAYIVTNTESTYGQGMQPIREGAYLLPEVDAPEDDTTAIAAVGANYSEFPEFGTVHQAPQPAFYPAVMQAADFFENELAGLENYLEGIV